MPVISSIFPSAHRRVTVISFCVSVPVLSEQITVADPSVSTEASLRISAWRLIISCMPSARLIVTTAGSPSGTAAIARLTAMMKTSVITRAFSEKNSAGDVNRPPISVLLISATTKTTATSASAP